MARRKPYTVTVVNPSKQKAKNMAKKRTKRASKKRTKKRTTKKKTGASTMARRRPRRRRTTSAPRRPSRRRSRRNPVSRRTKARVRRATRRGKFMGGFVLDPKGPVDGILARMAGKIVTAWCVRKWGGMGAGYMTNPPYSQTTGSAWTFKSYFVAWLAGYLGGELTSRMISPKAGADFYAGSFDLTATKLMWSELVHRWEPAAKALGKDYDAQLQQMAMGATEGDILDDGQGNRWLLNGGRWVSMQGGMGQLVERDHLGQLVEADYLGQEDDGYEDEDDSMMGQLVEADYLGHMMPVSSTTPDDASLAQYIRRGSNDPYSALYQ